MLSIRAPYWVVFFAALAVLCACVSEAQTSVHGFTIPTAEGPRAPSIAVCSSTSNPIDSRLTVRRVTGVDSRRFSASVCLPVNAESGPRGFSVPVEVVEAIEFVEHSLVAHFGHNSAILDDTEALPALDVIIAWVRSTPSAGLTLKGHTDSSGDPEYNLELAHKRTEAVKAIFVDRGVAADRIRTEWFGEGKLALALLGRQRDNRRVDIEVYQIVEGELLEDFIPPVPVDAVLPKREDKQSETYEPLVFPLPEE